MAYEVLPPEKIENHMINLINDVNQLLESHPKSTRILLERFNWDKEKLMERYYEWGRDQLLEKALIPSSSSSSSSSSTATTSGSSLKEVRK